MVNIEPPTLTDKWKLKPWKFSSLFSNIKKLLEWEQCMGFKVGWGWLLKNFKIAGESNNIESLSYSFIILKIWQTSDYGIGVQCTEEKSNKSVEDMDGIFVGW